MDHWETTPQEAEPAYGRSPTEREVLRALWASHGEHLVRSEIHRRMPQAHRPTLGRVGQILAALYKDQLLDRVYRRSQGSRRAGFYTLNGQGRELCRQLGFEREERLLFPVAEETLRTWLTPKRLVQGQEGHIVAVYGYRGGLGRTTLVAHVAKGLAEQLPGDEQLLVVDLDLGAPGLDDFFAPQGPPNCRGLGGLLVDFQRVATRKRSLWLLGALSSPQYVLRPLCDVPGLVYLPSGLNPSQDALSPSERVEALTLLRAEAGMSLLDGRSNPDASTLGFLNELRTALLHRFKKILIDPQFGHSLGSWIGTQALADELAICTAVTDTSHTTLAGLRAVIARFLNERARHGSGGGVLFLFRLTEQTTREDLDRWIDLHIVLGPSEPVPTCYRTDQVPYDMRLAEHRHRWENTHFYKHLIPLFDPRTRDDATGPPPELQALLCVLDSENNPNDRSIAAGVLENAPLHELTRWIDRYLKQEILPAETDSQGEDLIREIVRTHSERLLTKILRQRTQHWRALSQE